MGLHADGIDHAVRAPAVGHLPDRAGQVVLVAEVKHLDAAAADPLQPFGHEVDADDAVAPVGRDSRGHVPDRAEPEHDEGPAVGHGGVLDALPGGGQHVGEEQEAVVGRTVGNLDRQEVAERDAQELSLTARHLAVELGVAEQRRAGSELVDLRGLALRVQVMSAHPAVAAGDVERDHDAVADRHLGHIATDLLHDPHRLVSQHVSGVEVRRQHGVEVQIGAAQPRRGDAHDDVCRFLDRGVGDVGDAHVADALPRESFHGVAVPRWASANNRVLSARVPLARLRAAAETGQELAHP